MNVDQGKRNATLRQWASSQIEPWRNVGSPSDIISAFNRLNATDPNIFIIAVEGGAARLAEKPLAARHATYDLSHGRADSYRIWIEEVVRKLCPAVNTTLAVFVGDWSADSPSVPLFAFQKAAGERNLLLPDVDLIGFPSIDDSLEYSEKEFSAIFIGATSGGELTMRSVMRDGGIPRVRSAISFRDKLGVRFELPSLVQCDSEETAELLRGMGIGTGNFVPWSEQLRHRFILSMDGNGATCSRVLLTLASNSVLVKYASSQILYDFAGLEPEHHYLPVAKDEDVLRIVETEQRTPNFFASIAKAGKEFADTFLNRDAVMFYTAELLKLYAAQFPECSASASAVDLYLTDHLPVGDYLFELADKKRLSRYMQLAPNTVVACTEFLTASSDRPFRRALRQYVRSPAGSQLPIRRDACSRL